MRELFTFTTVNGCPYALPTIESLKLRIYRDMGFIPISENERYSGLLISELSLYASVQELKTRWWRTKNQMQVRMYIPFP